MVIVSFKLEIPGNDYSCCSASEANIQNPQERILDLPFYLCHKHITSLTNNLSLAQSESLPYWFWSKLCGHVCFD